MLTSSMVACLFSAPSEGKRQTNVFYSRKCRHLPECCGTVEGWEQKRILKYFREKYKPACFLLWSKWVHCYFCLGGLFKAKWH